MSSGLAYHCQLVHYGDVIMGAMASQITSLTIVYSTVYSDADQRKHQGSASLAFVWGRPVNSHKWPVTRKMFPFDDVIMSYLDNSCIINHIYCFRWFACSNINSGISEAAAEIRHWLLITPSGVCHYNDVIMGAMASQITSLTIVTQPFIQTQIKENIKAPRHWPLCGEFTGDRWIPRTDGQLRGKCFHLMTSSWWM